MDRTRDSAPPLEGDALRAVKHRGSHLQIIASAGSGKTEVVAQRIADLFTEGVDPSAVVGFTFTERAAESLKARIATRVSGRLGEGFLDRLNGCFIGTIHSYCFRLLQQHVPRYETFEVLDDHRLAAFLTRESEHIGLRDLRPGKFYEAIKVFGSNVDVVDNELLGLDQLHEPFKGMVGRFWKRLDDFHLLTYGRLIAIAVYELRDPEVLQAVHGPLRHLIVDEYQDINPAQEELIRLLAQPPVELCVVGDDDQSIYQWRGSDVNNIVTFEQRYAPVETFNLEVNRRSRPKIIASANDFAKNIEGRLDKTMRPHREAGGPEVVIWQKETEADEADLIARTILRMRESGYRYRDIAVLVRSSTSYEKLVNSFEQHDIPILPASLTGLFREPDAQLFGRTFAYLAGTEWRGTQYGRGSAVQLHSLVDDYAHSFDLTKDAKRKVRRRLEASREEVVTPTRPANLVGDYYELLRDCGVAGWDLCSPLVGARLGALARCSAIIADYESVRRRPRRNPDSQGEVISGQDRGQRYYLWLALHIQNWALGAYEGFEGEEDVNLDAVDLTTVHKAKGLEWPVVFVPCVSANRFPSSNTGKPGNWHVPSGCFDRSRYEGTENDERRLFYVAITRARDWLSVSTHETPRKQRVAPSPFLIRIAGGSPTIADDLPLPPPPETKESDEKDLAITFSDLAQFANCGFAYWMRTLLGFQPPLSPELGYGKAVHHVLREVAEFTRRQGSPPAPEQLELLFDRTFFLPVATRATHAALKGAARKLVDRYIAEYGEDLRRVWAVERPFELHLPNAVVSGRADVILDQEGGVISSLAIVDYKTAADPSYDYDLQLQVYADAARREGLTVRAAYVHDLKDARRTPVDVSESQVKRGEEEVLSMVGRLRAKDFDPSPEHNKCARCDVRAMCRAAAD